MSRPTLHTDSVLAHVLPAVVLNSVIALGLTVFGEHGLTDNWVYSQCIGLSIGVLIHQCSRWLIHDWATQRRRIVFIVPVSAVLGSLLGSQLGDWLTGWNSASHWPASHARPGAS